MFLQTCKQNKMPNVISTQHLSRRRLLHPTVGTIRTLLTNRASRTQGSPALLEWARPRSYLGGAVISAVICFPAGGASGEEAVGFRGPGGCSGLGIPCLAAARGEGVCLCVFFVFVFSSNKVLKQTQPVEWRSKWYRLKGHTFL